MAICSLFLICDYVDAAPRTAVRGNPASRKSVTTTTATKTATATKSEDTYTKQNDVKENDSEPIIENKSDQFNTTINAVMESATSDNSFAEQIRKQRAALAASESASNLKTSQQNALKNGYNACDAGLRECMMKTCGNDFTKCALDGDTIFGDKLNKCRRDIECSGEEFRLFTDEIKADRDMNVKLSSYNNVINCGNSYNACIVNECGTTYTKCLGKAKADAAIQKCATIAKECTEYDSGLTSRFGTTIGKLRENAEKDIKQDEEKLYALRDKMKESCTSMGAMFDERTFDCVYTVNFFAGTNQNTPTASRKRYAGETFVCMQEWFGVNATTFKENAYRETRAQTAASSAMLGSGVGTAVGLVTSGAIGRALDTQKAKKVLKEECSSQGGTMKNGECILPESASEPEQQSAPEQKTEASEEGNVQKPSQQIFTPTSDGCTLTFKNGETITNVFEVSQHSTNGETFFINMQGVYSKPKLKLTDVIKINGKDVNISIDPVTTFFIAFRCDGWDNGQNIAYYCKDRVNENLILHNSNKIGIYGWKDRNNKNYDDSYTVDVVRDSCEYISTEVTTK